MSAMLSDQPDDVLCCHSLVGFQPLVHRGMQSWKTYVAYHVMHIAQHNTTRHDTTQHGTTQYRTAQYRTVQCSTVQHRKNEQSDLIQYNTCFGYLEFCKGAIEVEDSIALLDQLAFFFAGRQHHGLHDNTEHAETLHRNQQLG